MVCRKPDERIARTRRAAGELESEVLAALWAAGEPLTPQQVHEQVGDQLAYNTVHTILVRLLDKGLVERSETGCAHRYQVTTVAEQRAAEQMAALLDRGPNRRAVLQRFVTSLNPQDEKALRSLLRKSTS